MILIRLLSFHSYASFYEQPAPLLADFRTSLATYPRNAVLTACSTLNLALRGDNPPRQTINHDAAVRDIFGLDLARRLLANPERSVIHRRQLLFLMKEALEFCSTQDNELDLRAFGRILLEVNDLMHSAEAVPTSTNDKLVHLSMQMYPAQEAALKESSGPAIRSHVMLYTLIEQLRTEQPFFDIPAIFQDVAGLPLLVYQSMVVAAATYFCKPEARSYYSPLASFMLPSNWFSTTNLKPADIDNFLEGICLDASQAKNVASGITHPNEFTCFRDRPLIKIGAQFLLTDLAYLLEKVYSAPLWKVVHALDKGQQQSFFSFWGRLFEIYVKDLLVSTSREPYNLVLTSPKFSNGNEFCDCVVVCGWDIVVIEIKGSTFSSNDKYSNASESLQVALKSKLVQSKERPQAVMQLARNITRAFGTTQETINGLPSFVGRVFPVVLTSDNIGGAVGVTAFLGDIFKTHVKRKLMRASIAPLIAASVTELEAVVPYLESVPLTQILEAHIKAQRKTAQKRLISPISATENRVITKAGEPSRNIFRERWSSLLCEMGKTLGLSPNQMRDELGQEFDATCTQGI